MPLNFIFIIIFAFYFSERAYSAKKDCQKALEGGLDVFPHFELEDLKIPSPISFLYYNRIHYNSGIDPLKDKDLRSRMVKPSVHYFYNLLRQDPELASFSNLELAKASLRSLFWWFYIYEEVKQKDLNVDMRGGYYLEKYRLHLNLMGIDPEKRPQNFKSLLAEYSYDSLAHGTSLEGLIGILKAGYIYSSLEGGQKPQYLGFNKYVYLEVLPSNKQEVFFKKNKQPNINVWETAGTDISVYLEIESSVLDELSWSHMNIYWSGGRTSPHFSLFPSYLIGGFLNMISQRGPNKKELNLQARNEFLFSERVPVYYIKKIYVNPLYKKKLIEILSQEGDIFQEWVRKIE